MSRQCEVEMFAIAVGVVGTSGTGYVTHDLEVISEANVLQIPVRANILFLVILDAIAHAHTHTF